MAAPLEDDDIDRIIETYQDLGGPDGTTYRDTAKELPYSEKTVRKYLKMWEDEDFGPDGDSPDFGSMGPDDFIEWFFGQDGFGVRGSFVGILARKADVRGKIPDRAEMVNELIEGNSGVDGPHEAEGIAEVYWDAAQRYLAANGSTGPVGSFPGGSWIGEPGGGQPGDTPWAPPRPNHGQAPTHTVPPWEQQDDTGEPAQVPANEEIRDALDEVVRTQRKILSRLRSQDDEADQDVPDVHVYVVGGD